MIVRTGLQLIRLYAVIAWPIIPSTASRVLAGLGYDESMPEWPQVPLAEELAQLEPGRALGEPEILFAKIPPEDVEALERDFGGRDGDDGD